MDFELFWSQYPRKTAKKDARRAWEKLKPEQRVAAMEALPNHVEVWADRDLIYVPYPATWLNGERWEDELAPRGMAAAMAVMRLLEAEGR